MKITLRAPISIDLERGRPLDYAPLMIKKPSKLDKARVAVANKLEQLSVRLRGDK